MGQKVEVKSIITMYVPKTSVPGIQ